MATALLVAYATLAAGIVGMEVWARRHPARAMTLDEVVGTLVATAPVRWFLLLGWAWLGWHLFVRSG